MKVGAAAVAAPVEVDGEVVAAAWIGGPSFRITPEHVPGIAEQVIASAKVLGNILKVTGCRSTEAPPMGETVRIACMQTDPLIGDVDANLARQQSMVADALDRGAGMVVLPECSTGGYMFESTDEAATVAEEVHAADGPALTAWTRWCNQFGIHLVGGLVERSGNDLYNAAVLVSPDGVVGSYRKTHLWGIETNL